jgi:serine/threonine-protein kinase RsbW
MTTVITFCIESDMTKVSLVGQLVQKICKLSRFTEDDSARVELAVVEAINNVIEHAYKMERNHKVEVICTLLEDKITVAVCDVGHSLNSNALTTPAEEKEISLITENLPDGGWGLKLIKSIMDEVTYSSNNGVNCMTLVKKLNG